MIPKGAEINNWFHAWHEKKNIDKFPSPFVSAILAIQFSKNKDGQLFKKNKISDLKEKIYGAIKIETA